MSLQQQLNFSFYAGRNDTDSSAWNKRCLSCEVSITSACTGGATGSQSQTLEKKKKLTYPVNNQILVSLTHSSKNDHGCGHNELDCIV